MTRREEYYRRKYLEERRYSREMELMAHMAYLLLTVTILVLAFRYGV